MPLEDRLDALSFEVEKSIRYHQRRRAFFERMDRLSTFLVILLGSATVTAWWPAMTGLTTTVVGAAGLVVGFGGKARDHLVLAQKFTDLARTMRAKVAPTEAELRSWESERALIDSTEPPIYRALEADCYNEVCRALGRPLPPWAWEPNRLQRLLMHLWRFEKGAPAQTPPSESAGLVAG